MAKKKTRRPHTLLVAPDANLKHDPVASIAAGTQTHILLPHQVRASTYELATLVARTGVKVKVTDSELLTRLQYCTDEVAESAGFPEVDCLEEYLDKRHGKAPDEMWCHDITVVT